MAPGVEADSTLQSPGAPSTSAPTPGVTPFGFALFRAAEEEAEDPAVTIDLLTDELCDENSTSAAMLRTVVRQNNTVMNQNNNAMQLMQAMADRMVQHEELDTARHEEHMHASRQATATLTAVDRKLEGQQAQLAVISLSQVRQAEIAERAAHEVDAQLRAMSDGQRAMVEGVSALRLGTVPLPPHLPHNSGPPAPLPPAPSYAGR